jgi:hypothetical protein
MSLIATENKRLSNVVKAELWPEMGFTRQVVVVNDTATDLKVGTVLGKVTATGKYKVAVETATDGSKVADAIVLQDVTLLNATDTKVLVLVKGPAVVAKGALVLHSSYDNQAKKDAVYATLEAKNINVHDSV